MLLLVVTGYLHTWYLFIYLFIFFKRILFVKKNVIMKNENEYSI